MFSALGGGFPFHSYPESAGWSREGVFAFPFFFFFFFPQQSLRLAPQKTHFGFLFCLDGKKVEFLPSRPLGRRVRFVFFGVGRGFWVRLRSRICQSGFRFSLSVVLLLHSPGHASFRQNGTS